MKLRVVDTYTWGETEGGVAQVIAPCCDAVKPDPSRPYGHVFPYEFIVHRQCGVVYAELRVGDEDGNPVPLRFCPSCGAAVEVVEWEEERAVWRNDMQSVITSGEAVTLIEEVRHVPQSH